MKRVLLLGGGHARAAVENSCTAVHHLSNPKFCPIKRGQLYITPELRAFAPAAGVMELIYKPDTVDELCETVARLADSLPV